MKDNILTKLFISFSIVIFSIITVIFITKNYFLLSLLTFLIVLFISKKENIKHFPIILFITSILIRLVVILLGKFPQGADFWLMMNAAQRINLNDFSWSNTLYFQTWAYQTGFVLYEALLFKLFKTEFALKVVNIILSSLTVLFVYNTSKKITNEKTARVVSLLYMLLPIELILNVVLNNHIVSALITYIGITFLIKKDKTIKDYIISSILISIGNILRPEGIIVVFSLIVFEILYLKKDKVLDIGKKLFVFLFIYLMVGSISSFIIQKAGINSQGLSNNNPTWKFVLGFNHDTCGYYSGDDEKYIEDLDKEKEIVKERIFSNPSDTAKLFVCKIDHFWLLSDSNTKSETFKEQSYSLFGKEISYEQIEEVALKYNSQIYLLTLLMCFIGVIFNNKKLKEDNTIFFLIMIITTFFVYLLIEIRPRYTYFIHISIFILSSYGYDYILNKIKGVRHDKKI